MQYLFQTGGFAALVLRLTLGLVILPHGIQKIKDFSNVMHHLQHAYKLPAFLSVIVILVELIAPILLLAGLGGRVMAALLVILMVGAVITGHHLEHGFFMNWFGKQQGEGIEYHLLAIGIGIGVVMLGSGAWSVDAWLANRITGYTAAMPGATH
jgi:Predicted membrane protein